jgi:predicted DNA-binding ribbon-helix-helix protein
MRQRKAIDEAPTPGQSPAEGHMRSTIVKRSVAIGGHKTSVSLEDVFWQSLREIAEQRGVTLSAVLDDIDAHRKNSNLSSHIRMFVLDYYRSGGLPQAN